MHKFLNLSLNLSKNDYQYGTIFLQKYNDKYLLVSNIFLFVSPELSSVRDYVITHSVRSM